MITQVETKEDPEIRALTDLEIEDVNGAILGVLIPLACFAVGVAVGVTIAK
jgi:hypothetical protein